MVKEFVPTIDASLRLVYRLNSLWNRADYASLKGKYPEWNNILDAIYRNLLYRGEVEYTENNKKQITSVTLQKKDTKIYNFLSSEIARAQMNVVRAKSKSKVSQARAKWYHALQKKDIWLRKHMQSLKLYLKENEKTPGSAMFGSFGGKR